MERVGEVSGLKDLREELRAIDSQILQLFARRMAVAAQVAEYKILTGSPVRVPKQEAAVLARARSSMPPGLEDYGAALVRTLLRLSRERQYELVLEQDANWQLVRALPRSSSDTLAAVQGEAEKACMQAFPQSRILPAEDAASACALVQAGEVDGALIPRSQALPLLAEQELFIQASVATDGGFFVLGRELALAAEADQASFLVELGPEPEALALVVDLFADLNMPLLNLQNLSPFAHQTLYFLEVAAEPENRRAQRALYQLQHETSFVRLVGWYPTLSQKEGSGLD